MNIPFSKDKYSWPCYDLELPLEQRQGQLWEMPVPACAHSWMCSCPSSGQCWDLLPPRALCHHDCAAAVSQHRGQAKLSTASGAGSVLLSLPHL